MVNVPDLSAHANVFRSSKNSRLPLLKTFTLSDVEPEPHTGLVAVNVPSGEANVL